MDENINLQGLLLLCKRRMVSILVTFLSIVVLTIILTFYVLEPKYEYSKQVMVGQLAFETGNDDFALSTANVQLIRSYMDVINSPMVLESIIKDLGLDQDVSSLNDQISIRNNEDSQIVTITVSDSNSASAKKIAELTALRSKEFMKEFTSMNYIQILDQSKPTGKPQLVFPKPLLTITLSALFGLFTGFCLAIIKDGFDTSIKSEKDLENLLGVPLLGSLSAKARKQMRKKPVGKRGDFVGTPQKETQNSSAYARPD